MAHAKTAALRPTRWGSVVFRSKVILLQLRRLAQDGLHGPLRHRSVTFDSGLVGEFLTSRSALRTTDEPSEQMLQLGKIQNLRVSSRMLDGVLVPAGETFSFWRQVGRATRRRDFVAGRELREGCIIATAGGGLCQLSNALHDLALKAGFEIIERHPHTQPVPGSAWAVDRDATVAWNHIDLRFRSDRAFRISAEITRNELVLSFQFASQGKTPSLTGLRRMGLPVLNAPGSCESCGQDDCFRHDARAAVESRNGQTRTAFLVDGLWPEFERELRSGSGKGDVLLAPRAAPELPGGFERITAAWPSVLRSINARRNLPPPRKRALQIGDTDRIARVLADRVPFNATSLAVDLVLLKELHRKGVLGGREVTVWLTRMPLKIVHELLDQAAMSYPNRALLSDFRADPRDVEEEWIALMRADRIVTPHAWLAERMRREAEAAVEDLSWILPIAPENIEEGGYLFFPGPTASREGALAVRDAARRLAMPVSVGGRILEEPDFWTGVEVLSPATHPMSDAWAVVAPAVMKNRPTALLAAVEMGKRVIATPQCGLRGVVEVPFGDAEALVSAIEEPRRPSAEPAKSSAVSIGRSEYP